jgi:hypothetical protein
MGYRPLAKIRATFLVLETEQEKGDGETLLVTAWASPPIRDREGHAYGVRFEGLDPIFLVEKTLEDF